MTSLQYVRTNHGACVGRALLLPALAVLLCCGGSKGNPIGPDPKRPGVVPAAPTGVRVASIDTDARSAVIQWEASTGADRYVVEYWNTFDVSMTTTSVPANGPETTLTLLNLPGDWLSVRVRAGNSAGFSSPSMPAAMLQIPVQKDVTEALFFGTGPYGTGLFAPPPGADSVPISQAHHLPGTMLGWGSDLIRVRAENALSDAQFSSLVRILAHVGEITGGAVRAQVVERASLPGTFVAGELHVLVRDDLTGPCHAADESVLGCAPQLFLTGGQLIASLVFVEPRTSPDTVSHEIGHALLGLHHVTRVLMPVRPVMSSGAGPSENGFSPLEVASIRAVYSAGLRFGATRADFQARGLIN